MTLEYEKLTGETISAAIEVHKRLGPGFIESVYHNALILEMLSRQMKVGKEVVIDIKYNGVIVGTHRLDLIVEDTIVVELKAIKNLEDVHFAIVRSYLKAASKEHGLILNFAKTTVEVKRVICH